MTCPNCGTRNTRGALDCVHCSAPLPSTRGDRAARLEGYAQWLALAGLLTCGVTALVAIPVAVWAVVDGRRRGIQPFGRIDALVLTALVLVSMYIFGRVAIVFRDAGRTEATSKCLYRLKQINLAALAYADDHGGLSPPVDGWTEALRPYAKYPEIFRCPAAPRGTVGYAYNPGAAGKQWKNKPHAARLVTFFDGDPGESVAGGMERLVARHYWFPRNEAKQKAVIGLADGTVHVVTRHEARQFMWQLATPVATSREGERGSQPERNGGRR